MERIDFFANGQKAFRVLGGFGAYLSKSGLDKKLLHLVYIRASQLNGCAYCVDMHTKDLRVMGEKEQRMLLVAVWHEAKNLFTPKECAALAFAEELTKISGGGGVSEKVYEDAAAHFTEEELIDLTMGIIAINSFNRVNVAFRRTAGDYVPGQWATAAQ